MSKFQAMWQRAWNGFRRDEQLVMAVCLGILSYCAGVSYTRSRTAQPLPPVFRDAPTLSSQHQQAQGSEGQGNGTHKLRVLVHVCGAVHKPGVYALTQGTRILDALRSAGGATSNGVPDTLDLAAPVTDGQQIVVPTQQQAHLIAVANTALPVALPGNPAEGYSKSKKAPSSPVNINKASASELETLPGIGPALAQRILEYRQQQGAFKTLNDLDAVKGVGPKKLEKLSPYVRF